MYTQHTEVRPDSSTHRRKRRWVAALCAGLLTTTAIFAASSASASLSGNFELDGDVASGSPTPPPTDWSTTGAGTNSIFTVDGGVGVKRTALPTGFFDAGFVRDFIPGSNADQTTFTTGSKDTLNISSDGWQCGQANNLSGKTAINNAYVAVYNDNTFATPHLVMYFGMEKPVSNGDNNMAVWMLQDSAVGCVSTGRNVSFTGTHVDGDILMTAAFTNGGSTPQIAAYKWENGALNPTPIAQGTTCGATASICALANASQITTPWQTMNGSSQGTTLGANQFYEGGIDLTANGLDQDSEGNPICVNKFIFDTRSSQSLTATLFDFAEGSVHTCRQATVTTNLYKDNATSPDTSLAPPNHTVTLPASVYDTATVVPGLGTTAGGTVTYAVYTDDKCEVLPTSPVFDPASDATVTIGADGVIPPSPTLLFTQSGNYWWQATYTPPVGSRDEGKSSVCTSEPLVVNTPLPTLATTPSATVEIGGSPARTISDVATISGGYFPSGGIAPGDVTFALYGPFTPGTTLTAASCTAATQKTLVPPTTAATRVDNTTARATSAAYEPTSAGLYQWTASYAGNAQNQAVPVSACGDTTEQVIVTPATPTLATKMLLSDRVVVSGTAGVGVPTGTVVFQLYNSAGCTTGTDVWTSDPIELVSGAASSAAVAVGAGTYSWKVTFTPSAGSVNYTAASTTCTAAQSDEKAVISYAGTSPAP